MAETCHGVRDLAAVQRAFRDDIPALQANGVAGEQPTSYLDHTGAALFSRTQAMNGVSRQVNSPLCGNPHSLSPSSVQSTQLLEQARQRILHAFGTTSVQHEVVFTHSATHALEKLSTSFHCCPVQTWWQNGTTCVDDDGIPLMGSPQQCTCTSHKPSFYYYHHNHTSVVAMRRPLRQHGFTCHPFTDNDGDTLSEHPQCDRQSVRQSDSETKGVPDHATREIGTSQSAAKLHEQDLCSTSNLQRPTSCHDLIAIPATCNFSGRRHPVQRWCRHLKQGKLTVQEASTTGGDGGVVNAQGAITLQDVEVDKQTAPQESLSVLQRGSHRSVLILVDGAAAVSTTPLNLSDMQADFVCVSFYKMFGLPTGLGCLLVARSASQHLLPSFLGGGSARAYTSRLDLTMPRLSCQETLETGTPSFQAMHQLLAGFDELEHRIGGVLNVQLWTRQLFKDCLLNYLLPLKHYNNTALIVPVTTLTAEELCNDTLQSSSLAFNVRRADGSWVSPSEVATLAALNNIHIRSGCMCNAGACHDLCGVDTKAFLRIVKRGYVCGGTEDMTADGVPIGAVRVSFGFYNNIEDVKRLALFLRDSFVQSGPEALMTAPTMVNGATSTTRLASASVTTPSIQSALAPSPTSTTDPLAKATATEQLHLPLDVPLAQDGKPLDGPGTSQDQVVHSRHCTQEAPSGEMDREEEAESSRGALVKETGIPRYDDGVEVHGMRNAQQRSARVAESFTIKSGGAGVVKRISVFPVKSCGAYHPLEWEMGVAGLKYDRTWMIVNDRGIALSQKQIPQLVLITPEIDIGDGLLHLWIPKAPVTSITTTESKMSTPTAATPPRPLCSASTLEPTDRAKALSLARQATHECITLPLSPTTTDAVHRQWHGGPTVPVPPAAYRVCNERVPGLDCGDSVSAALSRFLQRPCRLIRQEQAAGRACRLSGRFPPLAKLGLNGEALCASQVSRSLLRQTEDETVGCDDACESESESESDDDSGESDGDIARERSQREIDQPLLAFSNESQVLACNVSSMIALHGHMEDGVDSSRVGVDRFRGNIEFECEPGFAEDRWRRVRVGRVDFNVAGLCQRCKMVCIDQETGDVSREPLKTLSKVRRVKGQTYFGIHLNQAQPSDPYSHRHSSTTISVGDTVLALDTMDDDEVPV
eukprot:m.148774 g.148774  ORF g.148774 m.148774 type:complete len:1156 (-) comp14191_c0_seq1:1422-4889(-)